MRLYNKQVIDQVQVDIVIVIVNLTILDNTKKPGQKTTKTGSQERKLLLLVVDNCGSALD
jgi:hypothetical protein